MEAELFGSVPLQTFLPHGDIDVSIITTSAAIHRDTWAAQLQVALDEEQRKPHAQYKITDVQVINAEVRGPARARG